MSTQQTTADQQFAPKTLGLSRWVQLAFMAFAVVLLLILDRVITIIWDKFAEPDPLVVTTLAVALAGVSAVGAYRHATINRLTNEVVGELAKVSWPSRDEVQVSTVVVIITSIIASVIVGSFDAVWSAITDLIYKV
jgi:preprotein translocase SecE subunit